ncbi:hypothetical protein BU17DRAFT_58120 [Hysterangium stoloniferum]|nr:hypothetical protein BU17DRAFT_58120 [Hysterangium stoloniferum]
MKQVVQLSRNIVDIPTEILCQTFADRILVLVTQVGKVGNLIQASIPHTAQLIPTTNAEETTAEVLPETEKLLPTPPPSIKLTPLMGSAPSEHMHTLHSLYASQVATLVWLSAESRGGMRKPIIVGIALRKGGISDEALERKTFMGVMQMIKEILFEGEQ